MTTFRLGIVVVAACAALLTAGCSTSQSQDSAAGSDAVASERDRSQADRPAVTEFSKSPAIGTIMPNFDQVPMPQPQVGSSDGQPFSVTIDQIPSQAQPGQAFQITAQTTGYSSGNWMNVWVRTPDGTQLDAGGQIVEDASFTLPGTAVVPGSNTIQVSAGQYPNEQWSTPYTVNVGNGSSTAVSYVYHDLNGYPKIYSQTNTQVAPGQSAVGFVVCPPGFLIYCQIGNITRTEPNIYFGFLSPGPFGGYLNKLAPGAEVDTQLRTVPTAGSGQSPTG